MNKILLITSLFILPFTGYSQARLVFNNDGYMNIENNAYLIIDNGNANAITTTNGGNILSENERDVVKWNVGNATGNHIVPFTNTDDVKIPVEVDITTAGNTDGHMIFSTYRTDTMNSNWPDVAPGVTNMCSMLFPTDASHFVVDRFYRIDGNAYSSKPAATLSFGYDFANEAANPNTIGEANLQAQRFNPGIGLPNQTSCDGTSNVTGNWENLLFGTANTSTKKVNNAVISSNNFFKDWILVDNTTPLPVTLLNFEATCDNGITVLNWSTASENNNDYFIIEKSTDGIHFSPLSTVQGSGNSSELINYSYRDYSSTIDINYYRLKQVDFDGKQEYFDIVSSTCSSEENFIVNQEMFDDHSLQFNVLTSTKEELTVSLYDYSGRLIADETAVVNKGSNQIKLTGLTIRKGVYMLTIIGDKNQYATKLLKQ
jgi:hypothetical protein